MAAKCPVCELTSHSEPLTLMSVPVICHHQYDNAQAARAAPSAKIELVCCDRCSHIYNRAFDPTLLAYEDGYNNDLHLSPTFRHYRDSLIARLQERIDLCEGNVVEIGCGQGEFLVELCSRIGYSGTGYDPALRITGDRREIGNVALVKGEWKAETDAYNADLVVMRHVLEHMPEPAEFLFSVAPALSDRGSIYIEVPSGDYMLRSNAVWDVLYEHVSYFTRRSLSALLQQAGLRSVELRESFGGQYLTGLATTGNDKTNTAEDKSTDADRARFEAFASEAADAIIRMCERLGDWQSKNQSVALWGAGTKGVMLLNHMGELAASLSVVDINKAKQGSYVAGTGNRILSPSELRVVHPDVVLVMNAQYQDEIGNQLGTLGLSPEMVVL